MSEVTVAELEAQQDGMRELVERRQMALRLAQHPDFKRLILDGFCRDEAARYAEQSTNPALSPENRADALGLAQAPGFLKRFLSVTVQMGAHAERTLGDIDEVLAEARSEEGAA